MARLEEARVAYAPVQRENNPNPELEAYQVSFTSKSSDKLGLFCSLTEFIKNSGKYSQESFLANHLDVTFSRLKDKLTLRRAR